MILDLVIVLGAMALIYSFVQSIFRRWPEDRPRRRGAR